MSAELTTINFWDRPEYKERLQNEWFACGMIDPLAYKTKEGWIEALTHERLVKDFIYKLRSDDAEENKIYDRRNGIYKYRPGYKPISWDYAQEQAFKEYGKPATVYLYDPLASDNIDDYYFDYVVADTWCRWLEAFGCHVEGALGNQLVLLSLEQRSFFRCIFGWKNKATGFRRYSEILKYIPRKNSKTFDLACLALGVMFLDMEPGCKVVSVATNKEQARLALAPARAIINKDKEMQIAGGQLAGHFNAYKEAITANDDNDSFKVLPFSDSGAHGGNFHVSILDEIHEMEDSSMYDVCVTSQGSRSQPLIVMITTASTSEENFCNRKLDFAKKVARGEIKDDEFLPVLYYTEEKEFNDDWNDSNVHIRVNPMYGLGKRVAYMKKMYKKAVNEPLFENTFKRLDINMVTASSIAAFNMVNWNLCKQNMKDIDHEIILGQEVPKELLPVKCYAGLDLASKSDLSSLTIEWPSLGWVISWSFIPLKGSKRIKDVDRFGKRLNICGEEIIDFAELTNDIMAVMSHFNVAQLGFDPRFATQLIQTIEDEYPDLEVFEVSQSPLKINEATRSVIDDVQGEQIKHNSCILFTWQVNNCVTKEDKNECLILQKSGSASAKKIDAAAAWVNARALVIYNDDEDSLIERYEKEGGFF